jgi:O-antigen/teichoic acid export membrane protein
MAKREKRTDREHVSGEQGNHVTNQCSTTAATPPMETAGLGRILANATSILATDVVNRGTTFVLYALVARYLGAFEFGQLSLALTLFYTFQMLTAAGLKTFVVREVARDKEKTNSYLVNGALTIAATCVLSIVFLFGFIRLMGYSRPTASLILLLSVGLLPAALATLFEALFQAWERMHLIAIANVPANAVKAGVAFLALSHGSSLYRLATVILLTQMTIAVAEWRLLRRHIVKPQPGFDLHFSLLMLRSSAPFLGIDVTAAIWSSVQIVLLSALASETEVGLYSAAAQVLVPVALLFQSLTQTMFPIMCRRFEEDCRDLKQVAESVLACLLAAAIPLCGILFVMADKVLAILYDGDKFVGAVPVLRILVWSVVLGAITQSLGQVLLAGRREVVTLRIVAVNAVVSLALGLLLIDRLGPLKGAALATIIAGVVNVVQHYVPVSRLLGGISVGRLAWNPARSETGT